MYLFDNDEARRDYYNAVIAFAKKFDGKREISGNKGFVDKDIDRIMRKHAFRDGYAYCAIFALACMKEVAIQQENKLLLNRLKEIESASSQTLWETLNASDDFDTTTWKKRKNLAGALVIWRKGKTWQGHAGLVINGTWNNCHTIEGNTGSGNQRDGDGFYSKVRLGNISALLQLRGYAIIKTLDEVSPDVRKTYLNR